MRLIGIVICALVMSGCSSPKSTEATLTMWLVGSEAQASTINELAKAFAQQTGITVRCEAVAWGEAHSKYLTAVAGGVQPDLGTMGLTWGAEFGRLGALVDLRQAFPEDLAAIQQRTFSGIWDSIQQNNQVFGTPFDLTLQVLYYRTDLIPQPPQTWQDFVQLLERLGQENRRMIIDWGSLSWIGYAPFLWQAGGDFYHPTTGAPSLTTPQAIAALEFFRDLYNRYGVPKTSLPLEQGLRTGEFPLAISGNWKSVSLATGVPEIAGRWSIGLLPQGPAGRRTAFLGGRIISIFANSKQQDLAWKFVRYLFEPDVQVKLYQSAYETQDAYLPPNIAAWESLPMDAAMKSVLQEQAKDAKGPPAIPGWNESTHMLEAAIQRVIFQGANPKEELAKVNAEMNHQRSRQ